MKDSENILINILTRTSNRPNGFYKCYESIKKQTYKNVRHIVAYDNEFDLNYLKDFEVDKVYVGDKYRNNEYREFDENGNSQAIYNLYCNDLLDNVYDGWILFLDDDNYLYHNNVLEEIVESIKINKSTNSIFVCQMRYPNGVLIPSNSFIKNQKIEKYNIDSSCFIFHTKFKNKARWDQFKISDFRFLTAINKIVNNTIFIKKVIVQVNNYGDLGAKNDISNIEKHLDYTFNKNLLWYLIPKSHFELFSVSIFQRSTYLVFEKSTYVDFKKFIQKLFKRIMNFFKSKKWFL